MIKLNTLEYLAEAITKYEEEFCQNTEEREADTNIGIFELKGIVDWAIKIEEAGQSLSFLGYDY